MTAAGVRIEAFGEKSTAEDSVNVAGLSLPLSLGESRSFGEWMLLRRPRMDLPRAPKRAEELDFGVMGREASVVLQMLLLDHTQNPSQ